MLFCKSPIFTYTGGEHNKINSYLQLANLNLENNPDASQYINRLDRYRVLSQNMKQVFDNLYTDRSYIDLIDATFKTNFEVISLQAFLYFNDPNGRMSDSSHLELNPGSIIFMPNFLSTAYGVFESFIDFAIPTKVLYRIKINNQIGKGKNWVLIDEYSQVSDEKEIIIRESSFYVVEEINYGIIEKEFAPKYLIKIITMKLCEDYNDAIEYSNSFRTNNLLYGMYNENLFKGGRAITGENPTTFPGNQTHNKLIIDPRTILINPIYFGLKIDTIDDLFKSYFDIYQKLDPVISENFNKIKILNGIQISNQTANKQHNKYKQNNQNNQTVNYPTITNY